jgi:hypothetical protein
VHELARYLAGDGADYDALKAVWCDLPEDRTAALTWLQSKPDLAGIVLQTDPAATPEQDQDTPTTWADMARAIGPVTWAWRQWLPYGFLTVLAAEPEKGKSMLLLWLAKCFLQGTPWPDGSPSNDLGSLLWCEAEAAQALNLDRATKWGLPLDRIITPLQDGLDDVSLDDAGHRAAITAKAHLPQVRFVVVDSLRGANAGNENDSVSMSVVKWLAELARDTGKPIVLTHHLRKRGMLDGDALTLDRVRGSSALMQPARVVWGVDTPDPANQETRRLSVIKCNLAPKPTPLGFSIGDGGLTFTTPPEPPRQETLQDKAADLLLSLLAAGPQPAASLQAEFNAAGISWAAAHRAKDKLSLSVVRRGKAWIWSLPYRES